MIMSICFNPPEMDYPSWLTVSSFIMLILLFFMGQILDIDKNTKNFISNFKYYNILWITFSFLILIVLAGILCFIYNIKHIGAILITFVLFISMLSPSLFFVKFYIKNSVKEKEIDSLMAVYHPNIN